MIKFYRNTKLTSRLIVFSALLVLTGVTAWKYGFNAPIALAFVASIGALIEVVLTRPRLVAAVAAVIIQVTYLSVISITIGGVYGTLALLTSEYLALLTILLLIVFGYKFARGYLWLNYAVSFVIYDLILTTILATGLSYIIAALGGFVGAAIFLVIRSIQWRKKENFSLTKPSAKSLKRVQSFLDSHNLVSTSSQLPFVSFLATDPAQPNKVYVIYSLDVKTSLTIEKNLVLMDGSDVTPLLDSLLSETGDLSKSKKITERVFTPVIFVNNNTLVKNLTSIKVASRAKPDRSIGTIYLANANGFEKILKVPGIKLSKRTSKKISALVNNQQSE